MADKSIIRMNLAAITKVDPYAKTIIDSSSHVAFYTFNADKNEWEKTDVEGAFFIYNRNAQPYYSIFINNRLNTNSFVEPITNQLELQSQPPFLLYRNERARIRGFWFYNSQECDRIGNLVRVLAQSTDVQINFPEPNIEQIQTQQEDNVNIFQLLSKAQEEYNTTQTVDRNPNSAPGNVLKFFEAAKPSLDNSLFYRALPTTLSVEQLEKQHRTNNETSNQAPIYDMNSSSLLRTTLLTKLPQDIHDTPQNKFLKYNFKENKSPQPRQDDIDKENHLKKLLISDLSLSNNCKIESEKKPALMPPTMFEKPLQSDKPKREPLNSSELVQAFTYLLQNDEDFVNKLHDAYLKSFMKTLVDKYQYN